VQIRSLSSAPVFLRYFTFTYGSITSYPLRNKLTICYFLAVWQGQQKLFAFILTEFVRQALFTDISGLSNPPMEPEVDVIIDIYTGNVKCRKIKKVSEKVSHLIYSVTQIWNESAQSKSLTLRKYRNWSVTWERLTVGFPRLKSVDVWYVTARV
jgi:hypothetical protein